MNTPPEFNPAHAELHRMFTKKMRRPKKAKENPDDESEESDMDEAPDDDEDEYEDEDVCFIVFLLKRNTWSLCTTSVSLRCQGILRKLGGG